MKLPIATLVGAYAIFFACLGSTMNALPALMASHFDASGTANGWMSRVGYLEFMTIFALALPLLMILVAFLAGLAGGRFMNLPNRAYWLAPERREATILVVQKYMIGFCSLFVLFMAGLHLLVVAANTGSTAPHLSSAGIALVAGAFLAATGVWALLLVGRFLRTPSLRTES